MGQVDALRLVEDVRKRVVELSLSENYVREPRLNETCRQIWIGEGSKGGLVSGLWVEGAFPAEQSTDTLESLSNECFFPKELCQLLDKPSCFPAGRSLYKHQARAIRFCRDASTSDRPAIVVQAGTGAGKTESFLLPILSDLWTNERQSSAGGMRGLILYPMNALIADQVERVYEWLRGQSRLSVFHFNSETPENSYEANRRGIPLYDQCRPRTREAARSSIPDIVITNYSMLEYMLCRPQDDGFFGPELRAVVLDEAHLYSGNLAAEITLLLRRLYSRCEVEPRQLFQFLTSATLGGTKGDLKKFAAKLFSKEVGYIETIKGARAPCDIVAGNDINQSEADASVLAMHSELKLTTLTPSLEFAEADEKTMDALKEIASELVPRPLVSEGSEMAGMIPALFLHHTLRQAPVAEKLARVLYDREIVSLEDLAFEVWGKSNPLEVKATTLLLRLAAAARPSPEEMPLVPHRLHFLARGPEGISCCLNPACRGEDVRKLTNLGCLQASTDRCRFCGGATLPVYRCDTCGEWALAAFDDVEKGELKPGYYVAPGRRTFFLVSPHYECEGFAALVVDGESGRYSGTGFSGTTLYKAPCPEHGAQCTDIDRCARQKCPRCDALWKGGNVDDDSEEAEGLCRPFRSGDRLAISVVAETILSGLPPYGDASKQWKPAGGRRLLCFSDSRREAARLGPYLTSQHEVWLVRAIVARALRDHSAPATADYWRKEIAAQEKELIAPKLSPSVRPIVMKRLEDAKKELDAAIVGMSFRQLAQIVAQDGAVKEILSLEHGEKHNLKGWGQSDWESNAKSVSEHAEALIGRELDGTNRTRISLESAGLVEVAYPSLDRVDAPGDFLGILPRADIRESVEESWHAIVSALLDTVRSDRAVNWSEESPERKWQDDSPLYARWSTRDRGGWGPAIAFVGDPTRVLARRATRLWFATMVLRAIGCSEHEGDEYAPLLLQAAFDALRCAGENGLLPWLRTEERQINRDASQFGIQLLMDRLAFRTPDTLYRCPDTDTFWPRSVYGYAPIKGCHGQLQEVIGEEIDSDLRWGRTRREILTSGIFQMGLWGEEHSAQLSPGENKRRQDLFKNGIRNILSSTTTMELGIDIGGLNGVLLGNVPPSRANHLQRAGRAGRRADGSAVVVTYAREQAFDREVFSRFGDFLKRPLRKPVVFLDRAEFARRHTHAFLLGTFFLPKQGERVGAMSAYGRMGNFCGLSAPDRWTDQAQKPAVQPLGRDYQKEFVAFLENLKTDKAFAKKCGYIVSGTPLADIAREESGWSEFLEEAKIRFSSTVDEWRMDVELLFMAWSEVPKAPEPSAIRAEKDKANAIRYQIKARCDLTVIECLADGRFLPRYGFPINLQRLSVRIPKDEKQDRSVADERYRLERPSILALNEYVPGAVVLAGGRIVESRGILKHWTGENIDDALGLQYLALSCGNNHTYLASSREALCPDCGEKASGSGHELLFPRFGYTTAAWDPPSSWRRLERIGEVETYPQTSMTESDRKEQFVNFGGVAGLTVYFLEEAELLIHNAGKHDVGFVVCTKCGYAVSEEKSGQQGTLNLPAGFESHPSVYQVKQDQRCWKKGEEWTVLRNKVLAARENVDMLLFDWPRITLDQRLALFSVSRAIILATSKLLEIDPRELSSTVKTITGRKLGFVIYETTPGGSGHCRELVSGLGKDLLLEARHILRGTEEHHARCERACLDCLLDFSGQYYIDKLDRRGALEIIDASLNQETE
jgi:hypothetical protein